MSIFLLCIKVGQLISRVTTSSYTGCNLNKPLFNPFSWQESDDVGHKSVFINH